MLSTVCPIMSSHENRMPLSPHIMPSADISNLAPETPMRVADGLVTMLANMGVTHAFGVTGGAMARTWEALSNSSLQTMHFRHGSGAAFAAAEASLVSGNATVVFTTTGLGITNALTGLYAARGEGAKVILLSACTSAAQRGKGAIQETCDTTLPISGLFTAGPLFHYAAVVESPRQLPQILRALQRGLAQPGGFVAHISIPSDVQSMPMEPALFPHPRLECAAAGVGEDVVHQAMEWILEGPMALWIGFGARHAAEEIRELAEKTGAAVMCSPRGKGIFPESHPQFVGVTGLGGHASVQEYRERHRPDRILVLGTSLGEPTSFWQSEMIPPGGFLHVDLDPNVPGKAFPQAQTFGIQADIRAFVKALLRQDALLPRGACAAYPNPQRSFVRPSVGPVQPEALMAAIQKVIVEGSKAVVMAECGNSFTWATHLLRFDHTRRYRVSTGVGSMGHAATGVLGAAVAGGGKAVAIVGDGAMLMNNEINTAVKFQIPAVWIILNDARYNMCHQGMQMLGMTGADASLPEVDFTLLAQAMGAEGRRVRQEADLETALEAAMAATGPFVLEVLIDPDRPAPSRGRNAGIASQGIAGHGNHSRIAAEGTLQTFPALA